MSRQEIIITGRTNKGVGKSTWLPEQIRKNYLQRGKKILIIGDRGCGKTTFIKKRVIPNIAHDYRVIDFCKEYSDIPANHVVHVKGSPGIETQNRLVNIATDLPDIMPLIIDSLMCVGGQGFKPWFREAFKSKTLITVLQSVKNVHDLEFPFDMFDAIVLFRTRDEQDVMYEFIHSNAKAGRYIAIMDDIL